MNLKTILDRWVAGRTADFERQALRDCIEAVQTAQRIAKVGS